MEISAGSGRAGLKMDGLVMKKSYRPDEAAEIMGVAKRTVYRMAKANQLENTVNPLRIKGKSLQFGKDLMRPREVMDYLKVSRSTVYRWYWEGVIKGIQITKGTLRIYRDSVEALLQQGD